MSALAGGSTGKLLSEAKRLFDLARGCNEAPGSFERKSLHQGGKRHFFDEHLPGIDLDPPLQHGNSFGVRRLPQEKGVAGLELHEAPIHVVILENSTVRGREQLARQSRHRRIQELGDYLQG